MIDLVLETRVLENRVPSGLRPALRKSLKAVMKHYGVLSKAVTVVLTDDAHIKGLKLEHLGFFESTDVLSFPVWIPTDSFMPPHLGDLIISLETAQAQAHSRGHSLTKEVVLLASHGFTHLMGFEHPHAEGLGFEETDEGLEWKTFHDAARVAYAALEG